MDKDERIFFRKQLKVIFKIYDIDKSGELDKDEMYLVQNDLRKSLSLGGLDEKLFEKCFLIIDKNRNGAICISELLNCLELLFPQLCQPDQHVVDFIKQKFEQYDTDKSGYLERDELKLIFDGICSQKKLTHCDQWKIDYIISLIDDDGNGKIDFDEFMYNYQIVQSELKKNPPIYEIDEKKYEHMCKQVDQNKLKNADHVKSLGTIAKNYLRSQKIADTKNAKGILPEDNRINEINNKTFKHSRNIIPMNNLINSEKPKKIQEDIANYCLSPTSPRKKDGQPKSVRINHNVNFEPQLRPKNLNIIKISNEFNKVMSESDNANEHLDFFTSRNFKNLDEIVKDGCDNLVIYHNHIASMENFLFGVNNFILNQIHKIEDNNENKDNFDDNVYKDYQKMTQILNETFQKIIDANDQDQSPLSDSPSPQPFLNSPESKNIRATSIVMDGADGDKRLAMCPIQLNSTIEKPESHMINDLHIPTNQPQKNYKGKFDNVFGAKTNRESPDQILKNPLEEPKSGDKILLNPVLKKNKSQGNLKYKNTLNSERGVEYKPEYDANKGHGKIHTSEKIYSQFKNNVNELLQFDLNKNSIPIIPKKLKFENPYKQMPVISVKTMTKDDKEKSLSINRQKIVKGNFCITTLDNNIQEKDSSPMTAKHRRANSTSFLTNIRRSGLKSQNNLDQPNKVTPLKDVLKEVAILRANNNMPSSTVQLGTAIKMFNQTKE